MLHGRYVNENSQAVVESGGIITFPEGRPGRDGSNVIPTEDAIAEFGTALFISQAGGAQRMWTGTQDAYDALGEWEHDTLYIIDDDVPEITFQPLDSDLTAIAALTTTTFGRSLLTGADAAATRTTLGVDVSTLQPLDSDLTAIAALTTTSYGRAFLALADAAAGRQAIGLGTLDNWLTTGQETFSRDSQNAVTVVQSAGNTRATFFTARASGTYTKLRTITGTTAAATPTLCRMALCTVDGAGLLSAPIASTVNDTTLWSVASTVYEKATSSSFNVTAGQRLAFLTTYVGTTAPTFVGFAGDGTSFAQGPRVAGRLSGQTDIPAGTTADASFATSGSRIYGVLVP